MQRKKTPVTSGDGRNYKKQVKRTSNLMSMKIIADKNNSILEISKLSEKQKKNNSILEILTSSENYLELERQNKMF